MIRQIKSRLIIYIIIVATGIVVLSFSLSRIIFQPAQIIPLAESSHINHNTSDLIKTEPLGSDILSNSIFLISLIILITAITIYKIKAQKKWKELQAVFIMGFVIITILSVVFSLIALINPRLSENPLPVVPRAPEGSPEPTKIQPAPLLFLMIPGIMLIIFLIFLITRLINQRKCDQSLNQKITQQTQKAKMAIRDGTNFNETIINYYKSMCMIIDKEQNIQRQDSMTTSEFQYKLIQLGVPEDPIDQLTKLFERVRYGNEVSQKQEIQIALKSFDDIIAYFNRRIVQND